MDLNPVLFPAVTNREAWAPVFVLSDDDTGDLIDLSTLTSIHIEVRCDEPQTYDASGYGPNYSYGTVDQTQPILTADLGGAITILGMGTFQAVFTSTDMRKLGASTYAVGCTLSDGTTSGDRQLFLGKLPVLDGMVK